MKNIARKSIEDINDVKNYIFREFQKKEDNFIATNNFYTSEEIDNKKVQFNSMDTEERIIPCANNDVYISIKNNIDEETDNFITKTYIDLILLSNITLTLDDIKINKTELIHKILSSDMTLEERLFEDLYFNEEFSNKINLELPKKYNDSKIIIEDIEVHKKYLFKINILELNRTFYQYKV